MAQDRKLDLIPWIQEIKLPPLYSDFPNVSFYQNTHGTVFIGKDNGLTILKSENTQHIQLSGPVHVTGYTSDTLYYAATNDMGFLIRDKGPDFRILSRKHLIPASLRTFIPSGIIRYKEDLYIGSDRGIYQLSDGRIRLIPSQATIVRFEITEGSLFLLTGDSEILKWTGESIIPAPGEIKTDLPLWAELPASTGIVTENIVQVFKRNDSETWILSPYSLYKISDPSPLGILETDPSETGLILSSLAVDKGIALGTTRGLFMLKQLDPKAESWCIDRLIPDYSESVHLLSSADKQIYAAGQEHLFVFHYDMDDSVEVIGQGSFTGILGIDRDSLIASGTDGLTLYHRNEQEWDATLIDPSFDLSHSFVNHEKQIFFLCRNGVYSLSRPMDRATPTQFHTDDLLLRLEVVGQELLLHSINQVYRLVKSEDTFLPMMDSDRETVIDRASYPVLGTLGDIIDLVLHDSTLIITGKNKVSLLDLRKVKAKGSKALLEIEQLAISGNDISFKLSGLDFQHRPEPLFRYSLKPVQEEWSPWQKDRTLKFDDLKAGAYALEAEGLDLFGKKTVLTKMEFVIKPPFYKSWYAYIIYSFLFLIFLFLLRKWQLLSLQRAESRISLRIQSKIQDLTREKEKSDKLVAEVIPERTASQLKAVGKAKWDKYERATVLFSDIQGFTKIAEEMNPEALIDELDKFFFHFDSVVEKYNIEKIKTIGDAYMAAGGIPKKNSTNPVEVVLAALEMQTYMTQLKSSKAKIWDLRIGIHTGPVIAGVVGHKKVSYDIWGDTVNTASRMESSGEPGKVNISGITYGMVKDYFMCEYRGKLPVKYKGNIDMYFVNGLRPELSVDLKGIPNKRFFTKLQILRLGDLEDVIFGSLMKDLPDYLHFHKLEHAQKVYNQAFLLCRAEELDQYDRLLIRTAALLLFTGLSQSYTNFENRSAVICREILPEFQYSESQIDQICNLILATKMPCDPHNHLEKVLIDARMDYTGRPDFTTRIKLLFQELKETGSKINGQQFKHQQLELLYKFEFFTLAGQRLREVKSAEQMAILEKERWI
ncbi:MAG: adenylate/guanylate cyclase domain-containing protein [Bacteroidota bacterium]